MCFRTHRCERFLDLMRRRYVTKSRPKFLSEALEKRCLLSAANLVQDGGFETPVLTKGYALYTVGEQFGPWTVVGAAGTVGPLASSYVEGGFNFTSNDGTQSLDLTGLSNTQTGVQQIIPTTVGTAYTLSFSVGNQVDNNSNPLFGTTSTVLVAIDGVQVVSAFNNAGNGSNVNWKAFTCQFTATQTATTLTFTNGDGSTDNYNGLDSVSLTTGPQLAFTQVPTDGSAGSPLNPAVGVEINDANGDIVTSDNSTVITLGLVGLASANPIQNNTATVVNGIATFPNLTLPKAGFYQIQATDGVDAPATSAKFKISGDRLVFLPQPKATDVQTPIPMTVAILDQNGHLDKTVTSSVALSLNRITGGLNSVVSGTTTLAFVGGKAKFTATNGPSIDTPGTYSFTATEEDDSTGTLAPTDTTAPISSDSFAIAGFQLYVTKNPGTIDVFDPVPLTIALKNKHGTVDKYENTAQVQLSLTTLVDGEGAVLQGTMIGTFKAGVAKFAGANAPTINGGGTFTLTATESGVTTPAPPVTTHPFVILPEKLVWLKQYSPNPFTAERDFATIATLTGGFIVEVDNAQGQKLTLAGVSATNQFIAELPTAMVTLIPVSADAKVNPAAQPILAYPQSATIGVGYAFSGFFVDYPGTYKINVAVTASVTADAPNNAAALSAIKPLTTGLVKVEDAVLVATGPAKIFQNDFFTIDVIVMPADRSAERTEGLSLTTQSSVGVMISIDKADVTDGDLVGTTAGQLAGTSTMNSPIGPMRIDAPGTYTLVATLVQSPGPAIDPFDPANFSSVPGIKSVIIGKYVVKNRYTQH